MSKHSMRRGQFFQRQRVLQRFLNGLLIGLQDAEALVVGLLRVLADQVDQRALVASLRRGNARSDACVRSRQQLRQHRAIREVHRHIDAARNVGWSR